MVPESPEVIREATDADIPGIVQIIEPLEQQGVLVRRERDKLEGEIERFFVIESEGNILGCAALYSFPEESTAELACLAVSPTSGEWLPLPATKRGRSVSARRCRWRAR